MVTANLNAMGRRVVAVVCLLVAGLATGAPHGSAAAPASSEWPCGDWGMYGRTAARTFSAECPSAITPLSAATLVPAWTFRPSATADLAPTTFTASPTVVGGVVYIGAWNGVLYALDARTGAVRWTHQSAAAPGASFGPIVSTAAVASVGGRRLVYYGAGPRLYALDAVTGAEVWVLYVGAGGADDPAEILSSPVVWNDTLFVGMDVHDRPGGMRGGLLAVDAATGVVRWKYSSEEAAAQPSSGCGGVWGSPAIDATTGLLYFGTANCPRVNDNPALPMEEITALVASTGELRWTFRPHSGGDQDQDFGATPNLFVDAGGRKVLGAGSKDGSYYALDPATGGVLWHTPVQTPAPGVGGFIGSPAVWGGNVFGATAIGTPPFFHALDGRTGAVLWQGVSGPGYGASATVNGVVFGAALDNVLKAWDARNGRLLWAAPLLGPGSSGPVIAGDMVFIGSGTSSSDLCAKGRPGSEACFLAFDVALGQQGGVHAFRLAAGPIPVGRTRPGG